MNYLIVDIYHDFECVAGACLNTCCAGWRIIIDKETCVKMKEKEEKLGTLAKDWLEEKDGIVTARLNHNRCPMLDENNLCRVVRMLGPEYLSNTCTQYPRIVNQYGEVTEGFLNASCPEVLARLMEKPRVQFDFMQDNITAPAYSDYKLYLYEAAVRASMIDILQNVPDISLTARLFVIFQILDKAIDLYHKGEISIEIFKADIEPYIQKQYFSILDTQLCDIVKDSNRRKFQHQMLNLIPQMDDERFNHLVVKAKSYFDKESEENYFSDLSHFRDFIRTYAAFYTNYWVYRIFSDIIAIPEYEKAKERLLYIAAEFCLFQTCSLAVYAKQGLDKETYIYLISYVSRIMEHDDYFRKDVISRLRENDSLNAAGMLTMIFI